jgi:hypothetical protein
VKRKDQAWSVTTLVVAVSVAICAIAVGGSAMPRGSRLVGTARGTSSARSKPTARAPERSALVAEVEALYGSRDITRESLENLKDSPGMPACSPPPLPAATQPPGASYGVPFLAAITGGEVLAGYDEWTANHNIFKVGAKTYHLYPWQSKIFNITGWVTGLLQLPSLNAEVPPQGVVFCDEGGKGCMKDNPPPAGECIDISSQFAPSPGSKTPPPPITNYPPPGLACWQPAAACLPIGITLSPYGDTSLTVTGVEPDGALDLQVTTAAVTTATEFPPPPSKGAYACSNAVTTITLSTKAPTALPVTAPGPPTPPNRDDRSVQTAPEPLTGPLATASSTLVGNDFKLPAFIPTKRTGDCFNAGAVPILLNTYAGGWGPTFADQDEGRYYLLGGRNPDVAEPGWAQFTATTTVVTLGLPIGPPPNFHL